MTGPPPLVGQGEPCPRCVGAAMRGAMRREAILPVPAQAPPRSRVDNQPCCHDCALTDTMIHLKWVPTWDMARTVVGNGRQEQLRLPGAPIGLVHGGYMRPNVEGDLDRHHAWLAEHGLAGDQP